MYDEERERKDLFNRLQEHTEEILALEPNVVFVGLQGSQNYDLDTRGSDVDTKAIVLPSFEDLILNRPLKSYTHVRENNEHIDVKDIRLMFDCFKKQNINFLEIMFTPYFGIKESFIPFWQEIINNRELIASYDMLRRMNSMCGMAHEKLKALEHPYPSLVDKIEKYGYDPKQLSHIFRMEYFIEDTLNEKSFEECLKSRGGKRDFIMEAKLGHFSLDDARVYAQNSIDHIDNMKERWKAENPNPVRDEEAVKLLDQVIVKTLTEHFRKELEYKHEQ